MGSKSKTTAYGEAENLAAQEHAEFLLAASSLTIEEKVDKDFKEARKKDFGKPRMDLLPSNALFGIATIMSYGATKYNPHNYKQGKGLDWDRLYSACMRHLVAWNAGEDKDPESGASHLYHAGCCIMMLIDLIDSKKGKDTRFRH